VNRKRVQREKKEVAKKKLAEVKENSAGTTANGVGGRVGDQRTKERKKNTFSRLLKHKRTKMKRALFPIIKECFIHEKHGKKLIRKDKERVVKEEWKISGFYKTKPLFI